MSAGVRHARPTVWFSLLALVGVAVLIGLGVWQLQRLGWKQDLIARIDAGLAEPALEFPAEPAPEGGWAFRRVRLVGQASERLLIWANRTSNGRAGVHLVQLVSLADGQAVAVDRGWLPVRADLRVDLETVPVWRGPVTVRGSFRPATPQGRFQPDNDPDANLWHWADLPAMAAAVGLPGPAFPHYLLAEAESGRDWPRAAPQRPSIPNNHLHYALTWFALAAGLIAVALVFSWRRAASEEHR